jgi:hypothetical protein
MIVEERMVGNVPVPQSFSTSPRMPIPGQVPVITTRQLTATSGIPPTETGSLSLTEALKATMNSSANGRIVVIPGSGKRKKAARAEAATHSHMSPHLRHAIIIIVILLIAILTLLSLAPLANGQSRLPIFSTIGAWVHSQQLSWQVQSHNDTLSQAAPVQNNLPAPPMTLPKSQYVAIAQQDAIAVGISPDYFTRQINDESGFNPNSVSPSGAVGIAQFLPSTAAGMGINPWDPIQALRGAAQMMANYSHQFGGDYAKALAAYNGGTATVQYAVNNCSSNWLNCLPGETRHYIYIIMGI